MVQLVDEHLRTRALGPMPRDVDKRSEMLDDGPALVPHRADEDGDPDVAAVLAPVFDLGVVVEALDIGLRKGLRIGMLWHGVRRV